MKQRIGLLALALVAAIALAGCGSNESDGGNQGGSSGDFNDADVMFAQSMIVHHEQAVEMAKLGQDRASSPEVKELADKIEAAQGPEITKLKGWLKDWGEDESSGSMEGMDMDRDMPGMMTDADMKKLESATGAEFDRMFLTMMIDHHNGAIEMAKTEQSDGKNADAIELAKKIEADQTAEIAEMNSLLKS